MELANNSRIAVAQSQMNGSSKVISPGELISTQGNTATVMLDGEPVARQVSLDSIVSADALYGSLSDRPNEAAILDVSLRR